MSLPRLLQLVSPSLPVGAYSYSQGLEWAVEAGWVNDPDSLSVWLQNQLHNSQQYWDLPLLAGRESAELRKEEQDRGRALYALLDKLGVLTGDDPREPIAACQLTGFALAAQRWQIPLQQAMTGYVWCWLENNVLSGVKLVPLGQTDCELGASAPALDHASAAHESQHTRLFRS